jgi:hypothetical protein
MQIEEAKDFKHGIGKFGDYLSELVARYEGADILELGGGRRPSYRISEMPETINSYTVNDVSEAELALTDPAYGKACFDVSGDVSAFRNRYDVVFSRFLAEHVADGLAMHRNVYSLLKPGGVAFHLIPTLFASPFIANILLPETLTRQLLVKFFPYRKDASPKFPAYYSYCYGDSEKMRKAFADLGYSKVNIRNFYGHAYYDRIPVLREIEDFVSAVASKREGLQYSSFAHITAYK